MLPRRNPNLKHVHKQHSDNLWETPHPPHTSRLHQTLKDTIRHHQTSANANQCHHGLPHIREELFGVSGNICWCCLVSVVVQNCPEVPGGGVWEHEGEVCVFLWALDACKGVYCICIEVFSPSMVHKMLYNWKALKGKILHTWRFWNIKRAKPPYKLPEIIWLFHFLKFLGQSKKTLLFGSPCCWLLLMLMFYGTHIDNSLLTADSLGTANFKL